MKKIECLAVDDEALGLTVLNQYCSKLDKVTLTECNSALTALQLLQTRSFDLLFLDIDMPVYTGMELIKTLKNPPAIIITSAHDHFAAEGFEYEVMDYLVKPFSFQRFMKSMERFFRTASPAQKEGRGGVVEGEAFLFLKTEKTFCRILISDILYVESVKDYIKVYTQKQSYLSCQTLTEFTSQLPAEDFMRVHRSYTVALNKIDAFTKDEVEVQKARLPISREVSKFLMDKLLLLSASQRHISSVK